MLVVTKLDGLARSVAHLVEITARIKSKGAALRILDLGIDTGSATGELVVNMIGAIAQFDRSIMLERQREGIAKAKAAGRYRGRKPTARAKESDALRSSPRASARLKWPRVWGSVGPRAIGSWRRAAVEPVRALWATGHTRAPKRCRGQSRARLATSGRARFPPPLVGA